MESGEIERRSSMFDEYANEEGGVEFWYARDLMKPLGYAQWRNFEAAIRRTMASMDSAETPVQNHFAEVRKMVRLGSGAEREVTDYKLTRYACYLIAMNGDTRKQEIAFAQAYFAVQTRRQEVIEQKIAEIQRIQSRRALAESEKQLSAIVYERGMSDRGFGIMRSRGDAALFGGRTTAEMKERLGVAKGKPLADKLADVAVNAKALANSMTSYNVEDKDLHGDTPIINEHIGNNQSVRSTLVERGIYPESLPPAEDTKKLERRLKADERKLKEGSRRFGDAPNP